MIDDFRLTIDYLRNASNFLIIITKTAERADSATVACGYDGRERLPQIVNIQFSYFVSGLGN